MHAKYKKYLVEIIEEKAKVIAERKNISESDAQYYIIKALNYNLVNAEIENMATYIIDNEEEMKENGTI